MVELGRREFLKLVGLAGTGAALEGCSQHATRRLIPYVTAPEDIVPGDATWYASTCRECPAGCGLLAKNRDGRIIKVEGNPLHPVSGGKLCARGQSSLQGLYNPDRYRGPMVRTAMGKYGGEYGETSWDHAESVLTRYLGDMIAKGRGDRIVFITDLETGTLKDLISFWLTQMGSPKGHVIHEFFAYEPLRKANEVVFGRNSIPSYRIDNADFLISFNAGFLETWLSNVEYARQFADFHSYRDGVKNPCVFVGPRLSMTANSADLWISVAPGDEFVFALGILRAILDGGLIGGLAADRKSVLASLVDQWPVATVAQRTGVDEQLIRKVAGLFANARKPLALAEGLSFTVPNALETAVAANILNSAHPGVSETIDFSSVSSYSGVAGADVMKDLNERMKNGEVDLLLVYRANPAYTLPASWEFRKSMESVPMVVSFSSFVDETGTLAHWVLPTHTPLESWGDHSPRKGVTGLMQPVMGPFFDTKHLGDILISTGRKVIGPDKFVRKNFYQELRNAWAQRQKEIGGGGSFEAFWEETLKRGGLWGTQAPAGAKLPSGSVRYAFPAPEAAGNGDGLHFTAFPTVLHFDGREANRSWMQEVPDPMAMATWGGWLEMHPQTAEKLGLVRDQVVVVKSPYGSLEVPVLPLYTVRPGTLAMPLGQGHTNYGRYADNVPANPMRLYPQDTDPSSGGIPRPPFEITIEKKDGFQAIAHVDGSFFQHGRGIAQFVAIEDYRRDLQAKKIPEIDIPLPQGYNPEKDFYPAHTHVDYRWCMVVDLDRCIGCSACVAACYAENNLAVVGRSQVLRGREMSWLRIERFFDESERKAQWLPMLCQHCDNAPCEAVCPVYAPHHSQEGLNNQVYNRCIGTRFCLQNDPYKVRRFNWFTFEHPEPLNWQLNPDVTVRQKGVMEKCSFCIQRIVQAKINAVSEGRKVRDGEFTTACAQTCPTNVFTFGNLLDPDSRVSQMIGDPRAYQVLGELNTKPAVIYLKRVIQNLDV